MKKIVLMVMGLLFLSGCASGYQVNIDAPDSLPVGKPLVVTGTTTFGIGTPIDVVLYFQLTTTTEIKRKIVYVQSDKTFRAVFDTTGLKKGMYKVEVPVNGLGDSVTMRIIQLIDRSDDIVLSSPATQTFSGKMFVAGTIKGDENSGVQIEVLGPENLMVFGPRYVNTNYLGDFSAEVPVSESGEYEVSFTDAKGFIGTRIISVTSQEMPEVTPVTTVTTFPIKSAHARSSRDSPAYFVVKTGSGPVTLYTSSSVDWVIEYIDDKGILHMENNQGELNPEKVEFVGKGKSIDVKVYPYKYSAQSEVFLYAENANSVLVSPAIPASFAAIIPPVPTGTQKSLLNPFAGLVAAGLALWLITMYQKT
jgi:hypothetical protein